MLGSGLGMERRGREGEDRDKDGEERTDEVDFQVGEAKNRPDFFEALLFAGVASR